MLMNWTLPTTRTYAGMRPRTLTAAADILDDGEKYELVVELPGVKQENLTIDLEHDALVIRATREDYPENVRVLYNGRYAGSTLERRFTIGQDVDRNAVKARLENGLLTVTLPRKSEEKARKITVEAD